MCYRAFGGRLGFTSIDFDKNAIRFCVQHPSIPAAITLKLQFAPLLALPFSNLTMKDVSGKMFGYTELPAVQT